MTKVPSSPRLPLPSTGYCFGQLDQGTFFVQPVLAQFGSAPTVFDAVLPARIFDVVVSARKVLIGWTHNLLRSLRRLLVWPLS